MKRWLKCCAFFIVCLPVVAIAQMLTIEGGSAPSDQNAAASAGAGDMYITSNPPGAAVVIDGTPVEGVTPLTIRKYPAGTHKIELSNGSLTGSQNVRLAPDDLLRITIPLSEQRGSLKVFSEPGDALLVLDGIQIGRTPCKIDKVTIGSHELRVEKQGFVPKVERVTVGSDEVNSYTFRLQMVSYISITASPADAWIIVNGTLAGKGSVQRYMVEAGRIDLRVEREGYESWRELFQVAQGGLLEKQVSLMSQYGSLEIKTEPSFAHIYLDDVEVGTSPYRNTRLNPANYQLKISLDTYQDVSQDIAIEKGGNVMKSITLEHTKVFLDSVKVIKKKRQLVRRIVFGTLTAGFLGGGIASNYMSNSWYDEYSKTKNENTQNVYWDKVELYELCRNLSYVAAGIFGTVFVISIPF